MHPARLLNSATKIINTIARPARCLLVTICAVCSGLTLHAFGQPNLLLIYVDDLGLGDLSHTGHPVIKTPNLDSLAQTGLTLSNYYAPSALCSPSRAGLLTGRQPYRTGIQSWIPADSGVYLRDDEITLAELLNDAGYQTALIGKWHLNSDLGSKLEPQPNDQGFAYFYGHNAFQIPTNKNPINLYRNRQALPMQQGYTAQLYADEAIDWLNRRNNTQPFFLMLSMAEPHTSIENPPEYNALYEQYTRGPIVPITSGGDHIPKSALNPRGPGEYYANITYMDSQIGRVLDKIDQADLRSNTIVVFTSDNGPVTEQWINWYEVNAYGSTNGLKGRKHFLSDGGLKVPAIIRYPGVLPAGETSNALVIGTDWFSTLLNYSAVPVPRDRPIDSLNIGPVLAGEKIQQERTLHWALPTPDGFDYAIRKGNWKLMLTQQHEAVALYHLGQDPLELFNVLKDFPVKLAELKKQHQKNLESIAADPFRPQ
ncbi:MAG: sulfatase-like hydrolase/transferase [Gammaproteobacteria bacterium]|jgi:arylsulfatase A-like enzyme|nr:sulfatase-like hydrolase/transferase [Gammaproteobacteria bacterium]MBT5203599.1 sulfatase-like hydrolase/transferase [Gammaproteobacteria bacterium]MBT5601397.1 sulfatase-like hydrolase/transferase [Gammaproteobacteria bacterium]MBT6245411.1 sulfatase-like hydrolase/transferase [Gammaproteobacteria bacterium]